MNAHVCRLICGVSSGSGTSDHIRQRSGGQHSRGHVLCHVGHDQRLLVRLDRRRDVGEVAVLVLGLPATTQTLDPGHLLGRARPKAAAQVAILFGARALQLAHVASLHVQRLPLRSLSHTGRSALRLLVLFRRRRQLVLVLHRRRQVVQRQTIRVYIFFLPIQDQILYTLFIFQYLFFFIDQVSK